MYLKNWNELFGTSIMLYYKECNMKIISGSKGHRKSAYKLTTFCDADIWAAPVRTNACSSCTKGCMLPGRSQSTGASKQGKRTMYGSGIVPLLCCPRRSDKIWNMYGTNSAKIAKEHITCTSTYTEIHLVEAQLLKLMQVEQNTSIIISSFRTSSLSWVILIITHYKNNDKLWMYAQTDSTFHLHTEDSTFTA